MQDFCPILLHGPQREDFQRLWGCLGFTKALCNSRVSAKEAVDLLAKDYTPYAIEPLSFPWRDFYQTPSTRAKMPQHLIPEDPEAMVSGYHPAGNENPVDLVLGTRREHLPRRTSCR